MSSRSLAAARARRSGENAPPVSGNRPITSIGSQAAFAQQMPPGVGYNMPLPPNNVRTAKATHPQQQQKFMPQEQQSSQQLPFSKISISDAIGLITLRLGRVEQWIIDNEGNETNQNQNQSFELNGNNRIIDSSVLTNIINRLDVLEKSGLNNSSEDKTEEFKQIKEQFTRMCDDVNKHTLEIAKCTEQVFRFNRELTETKDILKSFMVKYDLFAQETSQTFKDYEIAIGDIEKRLPVEEIDETINSEILAENENVIMSSDLKSIIKQELANS
jgi:hypothetical protein